MLNKLLNTQDKKALLSNFFSLSFLQLVTYILPLLTLPYLVKVLGSDKYGVVIFAQVITVFLITLVDYGFNLSATRDIAVNRSDNKKITQIYSSVMIVKSALLLLSLILISMVIFAFERFQSYWIIYYISFLSVIGNMLLPMWYFQGIEKMKHITIVNIFTKIIFALSIFIFVNSADDFLLVPLINGLGTIVVGVISLFMVRYKYQQRFSFQKFNTCKFYIKESTAFFLSRLSSIGFTNSNTFIVGIILAPQFVTYYYLADKVIGITLTIYNPVVQSVYPYLSKKFDLSFLMKLLTIMMIGSFIAMGMLFITRDYISLFLIKEENDVFATTMLILLPIIPISTLYVMLGAPLLLARGFKLEFNKSMIYGFLAHLMVLACLYVYSNTPNEMNTNIIYIFALSLVFSKATVLCIRIYYVYKYKTYKKAI